MSWTGADGASAPLELPGDELLDSLLGALDHATSCVVPQGGPLVPFSMVVGPEGGVLSRFVDELVRAQETARSLIRQQQGLRRACVAYDGYFTLNGVRTDAVFVDGCDDSGEPGYVFVQRYTRAGRFRRSMVAVGNPGLYLRSERLFD